MVLPYMFALSFGLRSSARVELLNLFTEMEIRLLQDSLVGVSSVHVWVLHSQYLAESFHLYRLQSGDLALLKWDGLKGVAELTAADHVPVF